MAIQFRKVVLSSDRYESAGVFDVNGDGIPDIVSGSFWYEGPDFKKRHMIGGVKAYDDYYDDFSTIPIDVNGDGRLDFITGGWWGNTLRWRENTGEVGKDWPEHIIAETGNIETTRGWDVDGDGEIEIVPNTPGAPLVIYKLIRAPDGKATGKFVAHKLKFQGRENDQQGHGLGFGDITGNGRGDFIFRDGWLESPADPYQGEWIWHPEFDLGRDASVPILVVDLNNDGKNELIVGQGHGYGLTWLERLVAPSGAVEWKRHPIDPLSSQYHDLHWVDLDGDGKNELVTGKRFRAHPGGDAGDRDAYGFYMFKWVGDAFAKHIIDFGPLGGGKGIGIHAAIADLDGDGRLDIVAPGKDGLAIYFNQGNG